MEFKRKKNSSQNEDNLTKKKKNEFTKPHGILRICGEWMNSRRNGIPTEKRQCKYHHDEAYKIIELFILHPLPFHIPFFFKKKGIRIHDNLQQFYVKNKFPFPQVN